MSIPMNSSTIIPEDKDPSLTLIVLQVVSVVSAGVFLFTSRVYPIALVPTILLLECGGIHCLLFPLQTLEYLPDRDIYLPHSFITV